MYSQHPDIAKRWTKEYGSKIKPSKVQGAIARRLKLKEK